MKKTLLSRALIFAVVCAISIVILVLVSIYNNKHNTLTSMTLNFEKKDTLLRATLINSSNTENIVLIHEDAIPTRLVLTDSTGKQIEPFDEKTRAKNNMSVSQAMFHKVSPQEKIQVNEANIVHKEGGDFEIQWGRYRFSDLHPGTYHASVYYHNDIVGWDQDGVTIPVSNVWTGEISSNTIEFQL